MTIYRNRRKGTRTSLLGDDNLVVSLSRRTTVCRQSFVPGVESNLTLTCAVVTCDIVPQKYRDGYRVCTRHSQR